MAIHTRFAETAQRMIEQHGRAVTLFERHKTAANAAQPWRGPGTVPAVTTIATVVFLPASGASLGHMLRGFGLTLVRQHDAAVMLAATSVPGIDVDDLDALSDGTDSWKIDETDKLQPGETAILYALGLKKHHA